MRIHKGTKAKTAYQHTINRRSDSINSKILKFYSDGCLLKGKAGAGIIETRSGITIIEASYHLGLKTEGLDAELYGIAKATELAIKQTEQCINQTTDVWIYCNNQAAVQGRKKPSPEPSQHLVIQARNNIVTMQNSGIFCHIHRVPGHEDVKGNEIGEQLARKGAERTRMEPDVLLSITHLKRQMKKQSLKG